MNQSAQPAQPLSCRYPAEKRGFWRTLGPFNSILFGLAVLTGIAAICLQRVAFPETASGSAYDPILASVYVENLPAHVSMKASFYPGASRNLALTVTVTGPNNEEVDPALIVVQCTPSSRHPSYRSVPLLSQGTTPQQSAGKVLAIPDDSDSWSRTLSCYTGLASHGQNAARAIKDQDINLTMPVLQQNPDAQSAQPGAPLYAESLGSARATVAALVEVLNPRRSCAGSTAPSPASGTNGGHPLSSAESDSAESGAGSPSPPKEGACFTPAPPYVATTYKFPTTVATTETLERVNLADDRIDSVYPPGQVGSDTIVWQGTGGLAPSLSATNLASASRQNKDAFWAGLLYGLFVALALPFIQGFLVALPARNWGPSKWPEKTWEKISKILGR